MLAQRRQAQGVTPCQLVCIELGYDGDPRRLLAQARSQVDRYMAWPAQALGNKLGSLKIQALHARAQAALGPRLDMAAFHDAVLGEGALPLALLEARIDRRIAAQSSR